MKKASLSQLHRVVIYRCENIIGIDVDQLKTNANNFGRISCFCVLSYHELVLCFLAFIVLAFLKVKVKTRQQLLSAKNVKHIDQQRKTKP